MNKAGVVIAALAMAASTSSVALLQLAVAPSAAAAPPLTCASSRAYLAQGTPTTLSAQTFGAGAITSTPLGGASGFNYNAIGRNSADGYIYGVESSPTAGHILRIDPTNGTVSDLGPTAPALSATSWNSAGFGPSGQFYVSSSGSARLNVVDVAALTASTVTLSAAPRASDLTAGPGGYLWGATGNTAPAGQIVRVDAASGQVSFFSAPATMLAASAYGAAFTYGNGDIGLGYNPGRLYRIAISAPGSAAPSFTVVSSEPIAASSNSDATSCSSAPTDLQLSQSAPAQVAPAATVTWTLTVRNNGPVPSSGFSLNDDIPAAYSAITASSGCAVGPATVTCLGGPLAVGATRMFTLTAQAPPTDLCLVNPATVTGNEADPSAANDSATVSTCTVSVSALVVRTRVTSITDRNGNGRIEAGDIVRFSIRVTNTGATALTDVSLTNAMTAPARPAAALLCPSTLPMASLGPNGSFTCTAT